MTPKQETYLKVCFQILWTLSMKNLLSISNTWDKYESQVTRNSNLNGKMFEYILASLCIRGILPLYLSAKLPSFQMSFTTWFYTKERGSICWSVKQTSRRYKQADLESIALKYVHRKALSYLITLVMKQRV